MAFLSMVLQNNEKKINFINDFLDLSPEGFNVVLQLVRNYTFVT